MIKNIDISVSPEQLYNSAELKTIIAKKTGFENDNIFFEIIKKSIDARKNIRYNLKIVASDKNEALIEEFTPEFTEISKAEPVIIVGAGPAGYFAALNCIFKGKKPIILERGKPINERKRDIAIINRGGNINPESNFAFGEGGAGTYSDGKLYTRSKKKQEVKLVLNLLNYFGADKDILIDAHPHVGTDKLSQVVVNIRKKILDCGGEIHFNQKVTDLIIESEKIKAVRTEKGDIFTSDNIVLATGHSARDIYYLLKDKNISLSAKGFAMGVRVEHPQLMIDQIQYKRKDRGDYLPPATYSLVKQINGRGVYSFCMCPGGIIVPAASANNEIVVNGMSNSRRNSPYANSGIVVELRPEDFKDYQEHGVLAGLEFQKNLENMARLNSAPGLVAPAQRLSDFVKKKLSQYIPDSSYHPGLVSSPLHFWLPEIIGENLISGFKSFDKIMRGFVTEEAIVVGVESRTSSPVQIPRDQNTLEQMQLKGLYPVGEGAGYAGGIVSAAIDGILAVNNISN